MSKAVARCAMISASAVWVILSVVEPWVLDDHNEFLKNFVNHELLNFLAVVVTITLASAANLHLELNKMEEAIKKRVFSRTRQAVKTSARSLIGMLFIAVVLVVVKPLACKTDVLSSLFNGAALLIVLFNIMVLIDLMNTAFKIEPTMAD